MKTQRKLLTKRQKELICKKQGNFCTGCPLKRLIRYDNQEIKLCYLKLDKLTKQLEDFSNEEVEINL